MNLAKASTAKLFQVGPILDLTGAAVTSVKIATSVLKVTKNGTVDAADAQDTMVHSHAGHYIVTTDGGDFNILGEVEFSLNDGTNAMAPIKFQVVPAGLWDTLLVTQPTAAMLKFFDKASPTGTVNSLPDAVANTTGGLAIVGSEMAANLIKVNDVAQTATLDTINTTVDLIEDIVRNKIVVTEATGAVTLYADDDATPLLTNSVTSTSGITMRTRLV